MTRVKCRLNKKLEVAITFYNELIVLVFKRFLATDETENVKDLLDYLVSQFLTGFITFEKWQSLLDNGHQVGN